MKRSNLAVSETIGTLLLLLISVTLFSIVYLYFFTFTPSPISPSINLICTLENNNITLEHRGGESLNLNTEFIVTVNGIDTKLKVNDYMDYESKVNGKWNIGERVVYPTGSITDMTVSVSVVDVQSKSVIMMTDLQE